jgi:hypothetical protein
MIALFFPLIFMLFFCLLYRAKTPNTMLKKNSVVPDSKGNVSNISPLTIMFATLVDSHVGLSTFFSVPSLPR